jgi:signal peptidase I
LPLLLPLAQAQTKGLPEIIDGLARTPLSVVVLFVSVLTILRMLLAPKIAKTPPHLRTGAFQFVRLINEFLDAIIYAGVFVFLIIRPFGVQAFRIPSGSMWPTLYVNDFVVANKAIYRYTDPKPGDIVVFRPPAEAILNPEEGFDDDHEVKQDFIKRCIGVPGDIIEIKDGILYRNGQKAADPTKHYSTSPDQGNTFAEESPDLAAKASFKLVTYKGKLIPVNYTADEANASFAGPGGSYQINPKFIVDSIEDQRKLIAAKAEPIPKGFYLMMGDNRNNSFDGRGWGLVPRANIIGRSEVIWLPIGRMSRTPSVDLDK